MLTAAFGSEAAALAETYDGDTPQAARAEIRGRAQLLITNPDMLHTAILPSHASFARILGNLR
jgi:DEAD/DEAH box helicase domain-containing protein